MKKNIIFLTILTFLCLSGLLYGFVELIYNERVSQQESNSELNTLSFIELISPEIKTAVMKDDDIALLYSIEKLSKIKTVKEAFVLDKNLNVVIHNDSSKWSKKYDNDFYKNIVLLKTKSLQKSYPYEYVYSQPLNDSSTLCVKYSLLEFFDDFKMWKIKLYVYGFIVTFIISFIIYYLAKFFFLRPFNKTKKYLSVNEINKKTIYSDIVNMVLACSISQQKNDSDDCGKNTALINKIFKTYLNLSDEIFIIFDNKARLIFCVDRDDIILQKQDAGSHIVNLTKNSEILKNISIVLENPKDSINMDVSEYKINIIPLKDDKNNFIGIIISGNK